MKVYVVYSNWGYGDINLFSICSTLEKANEAKNEVDKYWDTNFNIVEVDLDKYSKTGSNLFLPYN